MDDDDTPGWPELGHEEEHHLAFLRDEGLELLALFRRIPDRKTRDLVIALIRTLAAPHEPDGKRF